MNDVMDLHTHSVASGHAYSTLAELVASAKAKGLHLLGVSDHAPAMEGAACKHYFRACGCVPRDWDGLQLLFGAELNIIDFAGNVDLEPDYMRPLDYCIASLHDVCITPGTMAQNTAAYLGAMAVERVKIIGHPDDGTYPCDFDVLCEAAKACGVLIELNNNSVRPGSYRKNARENAERLLEACACHGTKVIVGSDAHIASNVCLHDSALSLLSEIGFPEELVVNDSVDKLLTAFAQKQ